MDFSASPPIVPGYTDLMIEACRTIGQRLGISSSSVR